MIRTLLCMLVLVVSFPLDAQLLDDSSAPDAWRLPFRELRYAEALVDDWKRLPLEINEERLARRIERGAADGRPTSREAVLAVFDKHKSVLDAVAHHAAEDQFDDTMDDWLWVNAMHMLHTDALVALERDEPTRAATQLGAAMRIAGYLFGVPLGSRDRYGGLESLGTTMTVVSNTIDARPGLLEGDAGSRLRAGASAMASRPLAWLACGEEVSFAYGPQRERLAALLLRLGVEDSAATSVPHAIPPAWAGVWEGELTYLYPGEDPDNTDESTARLLRLTIVASAARPCEATIEWKVGQASQIADRIVGRPSESMSLSFSVDEQQSGIWIGGGDVDLQLGDRDDAVRMDSTLTLFGDSRLLLTFDLEERSVAFKCSYDLTLNSDGSLSVSTTFFGPVEPGVDESPDRGWRYGFARLVPSEDD